MNATALTAVNATVQPFTVAVIDAQQFPVLECVQAVLLTFADGEPALIGVASSLTKDERNEAVGDLVDRYLTGAAA